MAKSAGAWLDTARDPAVARGSLGYSVIVGTILIVVNHSDALTGESVSPMRLLRMGLTMIVPYILSTLSSIQAVRLQDSVLAPDRHPGVSR